MRANIVFALLVLMLGALVGGLVSRGQMPHATAALGDQAPAIEGDASVSPTASTSATALAPEPDDAREPRTEPTAAAAPPPIAPPLDRPLRVVASSWELAAPGVMANGGVFGGDDSLFSRARLDVSLSASSDTTLVENALARGGADPAGAHVIVVSLPRLVAASERLEVLDPRVFFVVGFAQGGHVLAGPTSLDDIDRDESVALAATPASPAALLGLFAFDVAGLTVELQSEAKGDGVWRALDRRPSRADATALEGRTVLTSAQASRLVPYVAVAREGFLRDHPAAAAALIEGWLEGRRMVDADPEGAARAIADTPDGPAMLTVLNDLRLVAPVNLTSNAELMGLAGRPAITLSALTDRTLAWWSQAGVLTSSVRPTTPIDHSVVALVARRHRALDDDGPPVDDEQASKTGSPSDTPNDTAEPLDVGDVILVQRVRGKTLDREALTSAIAWLAGVFPEAAIEVSVHPGGVVDRDATSRALDHAAARFDIERRRLVEGAVTGRAGHVATIRVRSVR